LGERSEVRHHQRGGVSRMNKDYGGIVIVMVISFGSTQLLQV
jgi:hypothetical protein